MSESLWLYRVRHSLDPEKRISLSVGDLEGNIFVVNVVMGLMEIAAVTVLMTGTFIGSGICFLICGLLDVYGTSESAALASTVLVGRSKWEEIKF